jgi:hypothetical protein
VNARAIIEQEFDDKDELLAGRPISMDTVLANHGLKRANTGEYQDITSGGQGYPVHYSEYRGLTIKLKRVFDRYHFAGYSDRKNFDEVEVECSFWVRPSSYAVAVTVSYGGKFRTWRNRGITELLLAEDVDGFLRDLEKLLARPGTRTFEGLDRALARLGLR